MRRRLTQNVVYADVGSGNACASHRARARAGPRARPGHFVRTVQGPGPRRFRLHSQGVGVTIVLRAGGVSDYRKSLPKRRRPTSHTTFSDTPSVRRPVTTRSCTSVSHRDHSCNLPILRRLGHRRVRCLCQKAGVAGQKGSPGRARRRRTRRHSSSRACPVTCFPTRRAAVGRR